MVNDPMSALQLTTRWVGDVPVIDASGRITMSRDPSPLGKCVRDLFQSGARRIVLNLAAVDYVDSAGLGVILSAYSSVVRRGGALYMANLARNVSGLLQLTRLDTVFDIRADESAALRAVRAHRLEGDSDAK